MPARLQLGEQIGAIPINLDDADPAEQIKDQTDGEGTDKGVDAVGFQATVHGGEEPAAVLNSSVETVRATGMIGVVGLYVPSDPGAFFEKGLRMGSGQANVKAYNRQLRDLIIAGRATPSFVVSRELPLEKAPDGYAHFDAREAGWTKVVLHPGRAA